MAEDNKTSGKGSQGGFYSHVMKTPSNTATQDTVKPKLSPYMQKRAAQDLVKKENMRVADSILNRQAASKGMTREEMAAWQKKNAKKREVEPYCGLKPNGFTKPDPRGSCTNGNYYSRE